jgi:copper chaperone CopZ
LGKKHGVIRFLVENIVCTGCAEDMENIMLAMDGVDGATIDYGSGIFSIQYDPEELEAKTIIKKVQSLGFKTQILSGQEHINI